MAGEGGGESAVADVVRALRQGERQVVNFKTFVPLNLEFGEVFQFDWRKRSGGRQHLLPEAGVVPKAVRKPRFLVGGLTEPGKPDAVRRQHKIIRGAWRRDSTRHLRHRVRRLRHGSTGQSHTVNALFSVLCALPVRPDILQCRFEVGDGAQS